MHSKLPSFFVFICLINYAILIEIVTPVPKDQMAKLEMEAGIDSKKMNKEAN